MIQNNLLINPIIIQEAVKLFQKTRQDDRWDRFVELSEKPQRRYRVKMRELFAQQLEDIVGNLNKKSIKAEADEPVGYINEGELADWKQYRILYSSFGQLELPGILSAWADLELQALEVGVSFDVLDTNVIDVITNRSNRFADSVVNETQQTLHKLIADSQLRGDSIAQLTKKIQLMYANMSKFRAYRIARTEAIWGQNEGAEQSYIQSGVVQYKRWLCARDERLCPFCSEMASKDPILVGTNYFNLGESLVLPKPEKIIEISSAHNKWVFQIIQKASDTIRYVFNYEPIRHPPLHPFCRCAISPVVELTRAYMRYLVYKWKTLTEVI